MSDALAGPHRPSLTPRYRRTEPMNSAAELIVSETTEVAGPTEHRFQGTTPSAAFTRSMAWPDARRSLNVVIAAVALVLCAPLLLLIAILVKLSSPGPIIYRQQRVGLDRRTGRNAHWDGRREVDYGGRLFTMYKFRTMRIDADQSRQVWATPGDPRVTLIGRVLRKYRLDELPQLVNVLKGDMNIVGPRPEQPRIFLDLRERVESYPQRQRVLPGITGWAQINLSYDTCIDDVCSKVRYDLEYIQKQSVWMDLRVLLGTLPVMLFRKGAW
jgi:lipopolysaccharide/colanic/teichoic acid biosynthesis glycosyltransferase